MGVQYLGKSDVLTLTPWTTVLAEMEKFVIHVVMHSVAAEENADHQIEIGLKEVDYSQFVEFDTTSLFIDHDVHDISPSVEIEAVIAGSRGEAMDDPKDGFCLIADRVSVIIEICPEFST